MKQSKGIYTSVGNTDLTFVYKNITFRRQHCLFHQVCLSRPFSFRSYSVVLSFQDTMQGLLCVTVNQCQLYLDLGILKFFR